LLSKCRCNLYSSMFPKLFHPLPYKVPFQKYYITCFQNADVFYNRCFTNCSSITFELPFKSIITSLAFKMWM
jgi:hypothetical protein